MGMKNEMRVYRAAGDDMMLVGYSVARDESDARAYLDNPNFGGSTLFGGTIPAEHRILDITGGDPWAILSQAIGREIDPSNGGYMISQALQLVPGILGDIAAAGYDWVQYVDDYPVGCVTLTACSDDAADIELIEEE
jgi:hypothetical protein